MVDKKSALERIIDYLPMLIIIVDENMVVKYSNVHLNNINEKSIEMGLGHYIHCINCFKSKNKCGKESSCNNCGLRKIVKETINTLKPNEEGFEINHTIKTNDTVKKGWFKIQTIPIKNNESYEVMVGITDISEYKERNEELIRLTKEADAANKAKSEFLANMSHEIRTPLNGIIGMTDLTLATNLTNEQRENLNVVKTCAYNLLSLINSILDLSKIEAEKVSIEHIEFELKQLIKNVIDTNLPKANEKYIELHHKIDSELPQVLIGDQHRISQVLNNLVSNAIKFTEQGFVIIGVKKIDRTDNVFEIEFSVEDLGIGISEDEMRFLFKSFSQVDGSITRKYGGTGLGLSISQNLVNLMGGEIKVESEKGVGSRFYFTIKLEESNMNPEKSHIQIFGNNETKSENILLVEDSNVNKLVIKKMLKEIGYEKVRIASNGIEALKLTQNYKFDIILMDIELPELDGLQTAKIIRQNEKKLGTYTPIIASTAYALKGDRERFLSQGMDDYISKPIDINELSKVLNRISNISKSEDQNIIKEYLMPKVSNENDSVGISISSKKKILDELVILYSHIKDKSGQASNYAKIEKIAHDIKMESEVENLNHIKTLAFKIELAARKEDIIGIKDNLDKILTVLQKKQLKNNA